MSNVVDLLERMGRSSRLQSLSGEQLAQESSAADIEPAMQPANDTLRRVARAN